VYEDGTQCSKTLAFKLRMLVNHPEESIQHLEHGKSLKSRKIGFTRTALNILRSIT
jgi:hypothetical protein